jgi:hypothetical protein
MRIVGVREKSGLLDNRLHEEIDCAKEPAVHHIQFFPLLPWADWGAVKQIEPLLDNFPMHFKQLHS